MKRFRLILLMALLTIAGAIHAQKYVGGDLSMLLKYEAQGATYLDLEGNAIDDVLTFVKAQGWNTIRVRLFDNPSLIDDKAVCQDPEYVAILGKRIKEAGLYFMLDIHYSDTWADPGQQLYPKSWIPAPNEDTLPIEETVYYYTKDCLEQLVAAGATPDFIQTGNEISFGMLWGTMDDVGWYEEDVQNGGGLKPNDQWTDYEDYHWDNFSEMLKSASKACREVCPEAKIIIHTEQCANNPTLDVAFFKHLQQYDVDYDIIGTSYYPYFKGPLANLDKGLSELEKNFPDKQIQLVETGYPSKWEVNGTTYDYTSTYPYTHEGQKQYTTDLIAILKNHPQVNGLSWWYAEANAKSCDGDLATGWYNASLFDNETGRALPALYELKNYLDGETGIHTIPFLGESANVWFTLDGRKLCNKPIRKGIFIYKNKKVTIK